MKKTVFLHIGYYKTGTSSIQNYCDTHRKELLAQGILYLETSTVFIPNGSHSFLALRRFEEIGEGTSQWFRIAFPKLEKVPTAAQLWRQAKREIDTSPASRIVISSEAFVKYASNKKKKALIREVKEHLAPYDVSIVCYLRRQDDYLESWHNQLVKMGMPVPESCSFDSLEGVKLIHKNFLETLDAWEEVFGRERMIVRIYDRDALIGKDIVSDFLHVVSGGGDAVTQSSVRKNVGLATRLVELKRRCNHYLVGKDERRRMGNARLKEVLKTVEKIQSSLSDNRAYRLLTPDERRRIMKRNEEINREISNRYFSGRWPLFPDIKKEDERTAVAGEPEQIDTLLTVLGMVTKRYLKVCTASGDGRRTGELLQRIERIERSRSWRITAPLRWLSKRLQNRMGRRIALNHERT